MEDAGRKLWYQLFNNQDQNEIEDDEEYDSDEGY